MAVPRLAQVKVTLSTLLISNVVAISAMYYWSNSRAEIPVLNAKLHAQTDKHNGDTPKLLRDQIEQLLLGNSLLLAQVESLEGQLVTLKENESKPIASPAATVARVPEKRAYDFESDFPELWFSDESLTALGMDSREVDDLRYTFEQYQLEIIATRNDAEAKGLSTSSRLTAQLRKVEMQFRQNIGDENYDKILYASGENNRLRISDLLQGSAAHYSGIVSGDVLYSYGGERVFDPGSFYLKTKGTDVSQTIEVVVLRDGEPVNLLTPGGRLGAKLQHVRLTPGSQ
jgi:hypothetical protein